VLQPLAQAGFRAIAPDLPGYGYSDKPADALYTIDEQARAVIGLLDRLGIDKAVIAGASYGGASRGDDCPRLSRPSQETDSGWGGNE
jgi:pimeloyl-ACP methyl ester carboxylesterase